MALPRETDSRAADPISFELDRFERSEDRLELRGRWFGVRGRRFVRPTLTLQAEGGSSRALADLEHKPWAAEDGEDWLAAFTIDPGGPDVAEAELAVAPDISVPLPAPGTPDQDAEREPTRIAASGAPGIDRSPHPREAAAEIKELRQQLKAAREESAKLREALERASQGDVKAGAAIARRNAALSKLDEVSTERDRAMAKRDQAVAERVELVDERDRARADKDRLARMHRRMRQQRDEAVAARDEAVARGDEAVAARDEAVAGRDEAVAARDEAVARYQVARSGAETELAEQRVGVGRGNGAAATPIGHVATAPRRLPALAAGRRESADDPVGTVDWVRRGVAIGVLVIGLIVLVIVLQSA